MGILSTQIIDRNENGSVELPDAGFITDARFIRDGDDLVLRHQDGDAVVKDYFADGSPPVLSVDGLQASPSLVESFLETPSDLYASLSVSSDAAGSVSELSGDVWATRDGVREQLDSESAVFKGDIIETSEGGSIEMVFADGTLFSLGGDSRLAIDEFVYDAASSEGSQAISILKGAFSFASGLIAKDDPSNMLINTPIAEIGIRGTKVVGEILPAGGESSITVIEGRILLSNAGGEIELSEGFATARIVSAVTAPEDAGVLTPDQAVARYVAIFNGDASVLADFIAEEIPEIDVVPATEAEEAEEEAVAEEEAEEAEEEAVAADAEEVVAEEEAVAEEESVAEEAVSADAEEAIEATVEEIAAAIADIPVEALQLDLAGLLDQAGLVDEIDASNQEAISVVSEDINVPEITVPIVSIVEANPIQEITIAGITFPGTTGNDIFIGGAGSDTVSYATSSGAVTVNLAEGVGSGGDALGDTFTDIENLVGSADADTLTGDSNRNTLTGGEGNDILDGGAGGTGNDSLYGGAGNDKLEGSTGADVLDGGAGTDTASYSTSSGGVTVNLVTGMGSRGDAAGDKLTDIENLDGSNHADTLTGDDRDNFLDGGDDNDTLYGGAGDDILQGGAGNDFLYGGAGIDTLSGSAGDDTLAGDVGNDFLYGGAGDDILEGGAGGDTLAGDAGIDTASYASSSEAVVVNLATNVHSGGDALGDTLTNIENLVGSAGDDNLAGDDGDNFLKGGAGNDILFGSDGNDMLEGGAGDDQFHFTIGDGNDTIVDAKAGDRLIFFGMATGVSISGNMVSYGNGNNTVTAQVGTSFDAGEIGDGNGDDNGVMNDFIITVL